MFHPSRGNVLFCSAADGWGFTVPQFARIYSEKFGFKASALSRALWGPYTLQMKPPKGGSGGAKGGASGAGSGGSTSPEKGQKDKNAAEREKTKGPVIVPLSKASASALPMFAQLVLGPLWSAYDAMHVWNDGPAILEKIAKSQGLKVPEKVIQAAGKSGVQV